MPDHDALHDAARATDTRALALLLERISRSILTACWKDGLHPAQWAALRFFAEAPAKDRTVKGLAASHGINPGTASRTVKALVARGLLSEIEPHWQDRRYKPLGLTAEGVALLRRDPIAEIEEASRVLPSEDRALLAAHLHSMTQRLENGPSRLAAQ